MNLPNYFLADLPAEAEITPVMVTEACRALKRNREKHLVTRSTAGIISRLAELGKDWLAPNYPFRKLALELGPPATGFAPATIARGLDSFFEELTHARLQTLVLQDLGDLQRLDDFVSTPGEERAGMAAIALGPELMAHFAAGNIPNPTLMSIVLGLLARSAQFVKCSKGNALIPRLFAHSLHEVDAQSSVMRGGCGMARRQKCAARSAECGIDSGADSRRRLCDSYRE